MIQAIVSVVTDLGDGVRSLSAGPLRIVLLQRGHLYLAAASTRGEPDSALRQQLHLLHQHLLLLVTGGEGARPGTHPLFAARSHFRSGWHPGCNAQCDRSSTRSL